MGWNVQNLLLTFLFPFGADNKTKKEKRHLGRVYPEESGGLFEEERAIK